MADPLPSHPSAVSDAVAEEQKQAQATEIHPAQQSKTTHGADAALHLLKETGGLRQPVDPEASKRLLRKIDLHIMPLICIVYFLQYIDKTAISYASVTGIIESTGLHGNQFNWVASIFFFGYVLDPGDRAHADNRPDNSPSSFPLSVSSNSSLLQSMLPSTSPSGARYWHHSQPANPMPHSWLVVSFLAPQKLQLCLLGSSSPHNGTLATNKPSA